MKNVGNNSRGRSQGVPKIFRAPMYRAQCAVIFAIAQLSCYLLRYHHHHIIIAIIITRSSDVISTSHSHKMSIGVTIVQISKLEYSARPICTVERRSVHSSAPQCCNSRRSSSRRRCSVCIIKRPVSTNTPSQ